MAKRRNSSDPSIAASFDWDFCLYCQNVTKENLRCPGLLVRDMTRHLLMEKLLKTGDEVERFENLRVSPIDLRFLENDKSSLAKAYR